MQIQKPPLMIHYAMIADTPMGDIWAAMTDKGLVIVEFGLRAEEFTGRVQKIMKIQNDKACFIPGGEAQAAAQQIGEFLQGGRRGFDFPIDWSYLNPFQEQALRITYAIPYGKTRTYADIARQMGKPRAARAVGRAEASNPMPLVIPCHRVVGSDGALHGYGGPGGIPTKAWLLSLEQAYVLPS